MREWSTIQKLIWIYTVIGMGATATTASGVSPLSLANAAAAAIISLKRFGKCEQDDTPTSSTPVPIKCNNGVLQLVDNELPSGYKRIASIKFDGEFWYETEQSLTGNDDVTMTLADTSSTGQNVFGSYNGTGSGVKNFSLYIYGGGSTSNCYFRYGGQLVRPRYGSGERTITFGKSGTEGFQTDVSVTEDTFETTPNAYIGMLPNSSSPPYTGSIIGSIFISDRLKYVPCERESDGAIGYYETVEGTFVEPTGTGTPIKGEYDYTSSHLGVVGTPEVITVSGTGASTQASVENLFAAGSYEDEQDVIGGTIIRRCGVCLYDGTQQIDDVFISTTGGKDVGAIIVYPLASEITESVASQPIRTVSGTNTVTVVANVSDPELEVVYMAKS